MKKVIGVLLTLTMLMSLFTMSLASEDTSNQSTDKRLAEVTLKVKNTLDIPDTFTEFNGDLMEDELVPQWSLYWSDDSSSLYIRVTEAGKIVSYRFSDENMYNHGYYEDLVLMQKIVDDRSEELKATALKFLDKVLDKQTETYKVTSESTYGYGDSTSYNIRGKILVNGLDAGLTFSIGVNKDTEVVTSFNRSILEDSVIGKVPSNTAKATKEDAANKLKSTIKMELVYRLDTETNTAVLKYIPVSTDDYYVDAATGNLVNLTKIYESMNGKTYYGGNKFSTNDSLNSGLEGVTGDTAGGASLTETELKGIEKMEGVLSKEQLDTKLKGISELGLSSYTLNTVSYNLDKETNVVTAYARYSKTAGNTQKSRYVTCNAKTAEVEAVSSDVYTRDEDIKNIKTSVSLTKAKDIAYNYVNKLWGTELKDTQLSAELAWKDSRWNREHSFTYTQIRNGIYLDCNYIQVGIDIEDGSIATLRKHWTDGVKFESLDGIVSNADAVKAWFNHYNVELLYEKVPVKLRDIYTIEPLAKNLVGAGYDYFYNLKLAYDITEPDNMHSDSVIAKTGEVESYKYNEYSDVSYDDVAGHKYEKEILKLADNGIGFKGTKCNPDTPITQLDMLKLIYSAYSRYIIENNIDEDMITELYGTAYELNILDRANRNDSKQLTNMEVIKMLLNADGHSEVANLSGVFNESNGYVALAKGFGIITGNESMETIATRGDALHYIYNYLTRS